LADKKKISGIILAGGKSARMGQNKAFIEIEGIPIIHRIHSLFETLFEETIIVTNQKDLFQNFTSRVVVDIIPNRGVLGGLYTGLTYSIFHYSFFVACDMPFLNGRLIEFLTDQIRDREDVVVPKTKDGLQPLHAIYSKNCLGPIKELIDTEQFKAIDFYPMVKVRVVEEEMFLDLDLKRESFINVNTPAELQMVKSGNERL
jgi:molybdopterin-guanine dinucleotide biosynthesis protein A